MLRLVVFVSFAALFQQPTRTLIRAKCDHFAVDNLGNVYVAREDELQKFLPNGKFFARYSNLRLGTITSIDATNPLKILLYYRDFQQVVFLDNQLSVNSEVVSLERLGYEQSSLVCASFNNSFWIYNRQNNELVRFSEQSKKIAATGNLRQILHEDISPEFMVEHNSYLYLSSPSSGIYVFDQFGAFSKLIPLKGIRSFQVAEKLLYYRSDSALCSYDHRMFETSCKNIPYGTRATAIRYLDGKLYEGFRDSIVAQQFD
jgi:hypothetical protein